MKTWTTQYKGPEIKVENGWFSGERLFVDGEMQDEHKGMGFRSKLWGKIPEGDGSGEVIKVSLGGWFVMNCRIFIDDKLIQSGS